jgi:hypothetical protein
MQMAAIVFVLVTRLSLAANNEVHFGSREGNPVQLLDHVAKEMTTDDMIAELGMELGTIINEMLAGIPAGGAVLKSDIDRFVRRKYRQQRHRSNHTAANLGVQHAQLLHGPEYDIAFSILAHEEPGALLNLLQNIEKFNVHYRFLVCLHFNDAMFSAFTAGNLSQLRGKGANVLINPSHFNKTWSSYTLLKGHMQNYEMIVQRGVRVRRIMLLASNVMFVKALQLPPVIADEADFVYGKYSQSRVEKVASTLLAGKYPVGAGTILENWNPTWREEIRSNIPMLQVFEQKNILLAKLMHEGSLYPTKLFGLIHSFLACFLTFQGECVDLLDKESHVVSLISQEGDTSFEEILLPTLELYFVNRTVDRYCWMNWDGPVTTAHVEAHREQADALPLVKRVDRKMTDELRQYITALDCTDCTKE